MYAEIPTTDHRRRPSHRQTTDHRGRRRAKRADKPERSAPPAQTGQSITSLTPPAHARPLTTREVLDSHLERVKADEDGNPRSRGSLKNHRSAGRSFLNYFLTAAERRSGPPREQGRLSGGDAGDAVDLNELLLNFSQTLIAYLAKQEAEGKSAHTLNDRRSILLSLRETCLELSKTSGLPEELGPAIRYLCEIRGLTLAELTRESGVSVFALGQLLAGCLPSPATLAAVGLLEVFFKLTPGTLLTKLPDAVRQLNKDLPIGGTPWREHQKALTRSRYWLHQFPDHLQREWDLLFKFFTDPDWAEEQGFETNSEWRIRASNGTCPTARINLNKLRSFFGYLLLDADNPDPWQRGQGYVPERLTLVLLACPDLVEGHLEFVRIRSYGQRYNHYTKGFFCFCEQLLRPGTGFLRQQPVFGGRLPQPVSEGDWDRWCDARLREIQKIRGRIFPSRKGKRRKNQAKPTGMTRDPFAAVRHYIEELDHPITVLWDLAARMHALTPFLRKGSKGRLATLSRDLLLVEMLAANPLRCENYAMLTYVPCDRGAYREACELYRQTGSVAGVYLETDAASKLYQKRDGSWWLRFNPEDFKNEDGAASEPYDVPLIEDVLPALFEYLFRQRPVLLEVLKEAVRNFRAKHNLPGLSAEDELLIDNSPYLFRPNERSFYGLSKEERAGFKGGKQMSAWAISEIIYRRSRRHLPSCKGFCAHACRHIVASHYIKNDPDGWEVAAAALHDRIETVRKHYAWVRAADRIKPWNLHYAELRRRYEAGEL